MSLRIETISPGDLRKAIYRLPVEYREAVWQVKVIGLSPSEAARRLGLDLHAFELLLNRGLDHLDLVLPPMVPRA